MKLLAVLVPAALVLPSAALLGAAVHDGLRPAAAAPPLACNVAALGKEERARHHLLAASLRAALSERTDTGDGYAFRLDLARLPLADLGAWMELERRCCPFLRFGLGIAPGDERPTLTLGGSPGVKELIGLELQLR